MTEFLNLMLEPLQEVFLKFKDFLPNLLAMLVILLVGILLAKIFRIIVVKLLTAVNFDSWSDRMGFTALVRKGDLWAKPSAILGAIAFWLLVIVTLMAGMSALRVAAIDQMVADFFAYMPRVISASIILVIGYVLSSFVSRTVLITAANSGFHYAKLLAETVRILLIVMALAMVMEQLRIAPNIVIAAFSIIFGGIVVALSIAFGVGGIGVAKRIIEKEVAEKPADETKQEIEHI